MGFQPSDLWLVLKIAGTHFVLSRILKLKYGNRRSQVTVAGCKPTEGKSSKIRELIAYNILTLIYQIYCASIGGLAWFDGRASDLGMTRQDRIYGYSSAAHKIILATAAFEVYNTIAVVMMPEYCNAAFIGHHVTTGLLATFGLFPFLHYYGFFFMGLACVSSVPLALIDFFTLLECPNLLELSQSIFAVLFLAIRTVYWPIISAGFWSDMVETLQAGEIHSNVAAGTFLVANVGLTCLQFYWTTMILQGISDKFFAGEKKD